MNIKGTTKCLCHIIAPLGILLITNETFNSVPVRRSVGRSVSQSDTLKSELCYKIYKILI